MTVLLEPRPTRGEEVPTRSVPPAGGGGGRGAERRPDPLPVWLAVTIVALMAVGLTYLGMVTQIWANLSGAQLPGA